jgi:hypothetical protein
LRREAHHSRLHPAMASQSRFQINSLTSNDCESHIR